jgi:hypothetical protein
MKRDPEPTVAEASSPYWRKGWGFPFAQNVVQFICEPLQSVVQAVFPVGGSQGTWHIG